MSCRPLLAFVLLVAACGDPPMKSPADVDFHIAEGEYDAACRGLAAETAEMRGYTAGALAKKVHPTSDACLCASVYDAEAGKVDEAIATGLAKTRRDDLAECLAKALTDDRVTGRAEVANWIGAMKAESGYDALAVAAKDADPAVRRAAADGLSATERYVPLLLELVGTDADAGVREAAAVALLHRKQDAAVPVLVAAATKDPDAKVRSAATITLGTFERADADVGICTALLEDPEESVRAAAVTAFTKARRKDVVACMKKRLLKEEPSEAVRAGVIQGLKAARMDEAKAVLCDAMGPYVRMYVKDGELPGEASPSDIVRAQNEVDWERSYACVQKAIAHGGHSCYGRYHLTFWLNELGGKSSLRRCPGMPKEGEASGGGGTEMSFE